MSDETILSEVVAASLGGAISSSILYPLEVLKTKMQAEATTTAGCDESCDDNDDDRSDDDTTIKNNQLGDGMIPFALKLYKNEGYGIFFRGIETSAFQSSLEKALYFFAYTSFKDVYYMLSQKRSMDTLTNLALGCAAEWAHLPITLPVDAWTTRIQTTKSNETPLAILMTMLSDKDCNFYKGISAYYILCFKPALQYTIYEQVKKVLIQNRQNGRSNTGLTTTLSSMEAFVLGMIARTVSTVVVFPFLRAKILLQAQTVSQQLSSASNKIPDSTNSNTSTITEIMWKEWKKAGLSGLFKGLGPELTRGIFSAALMLMLKEKIAEIVKRLVIRTSSRQIGK